MQLPNLPIDRSQLPIGIFDSGIGGLTVARQLRALLPNEDLIYFGDTAHLPYGDKSVAALQAYSIKICEMLLRQPVKAILIACYSATAAAFDLVKEYSASRALVYNVVDPIVGHLADGFSNRHVGLIGTRQTVSSNVFKRKLDDLNASVHLKSLATPLLAPMIEEGFINNSVSKEVVNNYLKSPELQDIEALVLACTHYPLIAPQIEEYYQGKVEVIDTAAVVARRFKKELEAHSLINATGKGEANFYVSDYTKSFEASSRYFFGSEVKLEAYPLWS